jgi:hypothetical protein
MRSSTSRGGWAALCTTALVLGLGFPATAEVATSGTPGQTVGTTSDEASAQVAARREGTPVLVESKTTETVEVYANSDGSFTWRQHERPVRVKQGSEWAPVDTTLVRRADGTIGPRVAAVELALSGGGGGSEESPLVLLGHQDKEVGLGWGADLPVPVLDGPTATYSEVLPGVDMKVTADVLGFSEVLVVKSAAAAENPALARVTFDSLTRNTQVRATPAGEDDPNLQVVDAGGAVVFSGDSTRMWDSSGSGTPAEHELGVAEGRRSSSMDTEVSGPSVSIMPDQGFLADERTTYPVFLDPDYVCTACGKAHHAVTQSGFPNAANYDATSGSLTDLKSGYQTSDGSGVSRSFVQMNTSAVAGKTVNWATLNTTLNYSWWGGSNARPTELYVTGGQMGPGTTWNSQPPGPWTFQSSSNVTNQSSTPNVSMQFDATNAVRSAAQNNSAAITLLLKGEQEGDTRSWRRFGLNPYLEVHYDSTPNNPVGLAMQRGTLPCVVGANRPWVATRTPTIQGWVSDPDGGGLAVRYATIGGPSGQDVAGTFHEVTAVDMPWFSTPGPNQGALAQIQIPSGWITTDGVYRWAMGVTDGQLYSPRWAWDCEFNVDSTTPLAPIVSRQGAAPVNQGDVASFSVTVDMATSGFYDIDRFVYTTDGSEPSTQGSPSVPATKVVNGSSITATATVNTTAINANQNLVKMRAVNKAGTPGPNGTCASPLTTQATACAYVVEPLTSAKFLKGAWALDDTFGTTASDQVPALATGETAHPLTLHGGATWVQGYNRGNSWTQSEVLGAKDGTRGGMYLTGSGYLDTSSKVVDTTGSFTVATWAYLTGTSSFYTVLSQDGAQASGFYLQYSTSLGKWVFSTTSADSVSSTVTRATSTDSAAVPQVNVWTHLAGSYDAQTKQLSLFVNGNKTTSHLGLLWVSRPSLIARR